MAFTIAGRPGYDRVIYANSGFVLVVLNNGVNM